MKRKVWPALSACILTLAAVNAAVGPTYAGSPHTIDPALVTPELNPQFAPWTCISTGVGATCTGELLDVYANQPIGLQCGGEDVYVTGRLGARMVRWHDADLNAVKTSLQTQFVDRLTLSPTGDPSSDYVVFSGGWHKHYDYPVPGDLDARVLTETGSIYLMHKPGEGQLLQDTGRIRFLPGEDYNLVDEMHGVHQVYDGSGDVDAAICEGLTP